MLRRAALFAALALLSGCASVPKDFQFDPSSSDGLIVGSITYESSIGQYSLVIAAPGGKFLVASVGYSMWPPLGPLQDEKLGTRGGTFALAAPAGEYQIVGWQIKQGYKTTRNTVPISIPLVVGKAGTSYVGNLHFSPHWDDNRLRDMSERDLPVLASRYDAIKSAPVAFTIAKGTELPKFGGEYSSRYQMPIIIPIVVR